MCHWFFFLATLAWQVTEVWSGGGLLTLLDYVLILWYVFRSESSPQCLAWLILHPAPSSLDVGNVFLFCFVFEKLLAVKVMWCGLFQHRLFFLERVGRNWWKALTVPEHKGFIPCWNFAWINTTLLQFTEAKLVKSDPVPDCFYLFSLCVRYYTHLSLS